MRTTTIITAASGVVAAAGITLGAAALSNASTPAAVPASVTYGEASAAPGDHGPGSHTPVTGSELANVTAAVKAKDPSVTITSVGKDGDGSYDVWGTKAGANVKLEVSKDLKTITTDTHGPGGPGDHGGPGGPGNHTPVTGSELANVTAAVKAKDPSVTITSVGKDGDGSYDVWGTKAGANVKLEVSKDLKTITTDTRGPGQ